jgi:hypothetical protein
LPKSLLFNTNNSHSLYYTGFGISTVEFHRILD